MQSLDEERILIVQNVRRWGGAASDAVLDPSCNIFRIPTIEGIIGYRVESGCAVVFGDPLCAASDIPELTLSFDRFCKENGYKLIFVTSTEQFSNWALKNLCNASIVFGEELIIDPHKDPRKNTGVNGSLVRRKVKHALKENVVVKEYTSQNLEIEESIQKVADAWLEKRRGPQIYISHVRLFADSFGKRWFYAQQGENIVGVVLLNQLQAHQGWLINHLMITPTAPHGTQELLITTVLETLANEGCHFVTFGSVPKESIDQIQGFSKLSSMLIQGSYKLAKHIFRLEGHKKFWEKFQVQSRPSYILFNQPTIGLQEISALTQALNVQL